MSKNPRSVNFQPLHDGDAGDRAAYRKEVIDNSTAASTGDDGEAAGTRAKKALETETGEA